MFLKHQLPRMFLKHQLPRKLDARGMFLLAATANKQHLPLLHTHRPYRDQKRIDRVRYTHATIFQQDLHPQTSHGATRHRITRLTGRWWSEYYIPYDVCIYTQPGTCINNSLESLPLTLTTSHTLHGGYNASSSAYTSICSDLHLLSCTHRQDLFGLAAPSASIILSWVDLCILKLLRTTTPHKVYHSSHPYNCKSTYHTPLITTKAAL
jgi:hypothetical protein